VFRFGEVSGRTTGGPTSYIKGEGFDSHRGGQARGRCQRRSRRRGRLAIPKKIPKTNSYYAMMNEKTCGGGKDVGRLVLAWG